MQNEINQIILSLNEEGTGQDKLLKIDPYFFKIADYIRSQLGFSDFSEGDFGMEIEDSFSGIYYNREFHKKLPILPRFLSLGIYGKNPNSKLDTFSLDIGFWTPDSTSEKLLNRYSFSTGSKEFLDKYRDLSEVRDLKFGSRAHYETRRTHYQESDIPFMRRIFPPPVNEKITFQPNELEEVITFVLKEGKKCLGILKEIEDE